VFRGVVTESDALSRHGFTFPHTAATGVRLRGKYKTVKHETMTEVESNALDRIQSLIQHFQNADRIVLGTPTWNFGGE
jgi:FMN-dependent NADH-azoreductase